MCDSAPGALSLGSAPLLPGPGTTQLCPKCPAKPFEPSGCQAAAPPKERGGDRAQPLQGQCHGQDLRDRALWLHAACQGQKPASFHRGAGSQEPAGGRCRRREATSWCSRRCECADCTGSPGVGEAPGIRGARGPGVRGRCKHSLFPPQPACSWGRRPLPPSPHGVPAARPRAATFPHPRRRQPLPLAHSLDAWKRAQGVSPPCGRVSIQAGSQPQDCPCDLGLTISRRQERQRAEAAMR